MMKARGKGETLTGTYIHRESERERVRERGERESSIALLEI